MCQWNKVYDTERGMVIGMNYSEAWLKYNKISNYNLSDVALFCDFEGETKTTAAKELEEGFLRLYGRKLVQAGNEAEFLEKRAGVWLRINGSQSVSKEGYHISCKEGRCILTAASKAGVLYGVFALLRNLVVFQVENYDQWSFEERKEPYQPLRMLNHWDNMDGSIERGYSGSSFFFQQDEILLNDRTRDYARMVASVGINGVVINNVNVKGAATALISDRYYDKLKVLSELFSSYGIKLFISINFAAPLELGGLSTADPCREEVRCWWAEKAKEVWRKVPALGGFLIKADSEGRPGPFTYGRTHADGANMLAEAVKPFGGLVIWRCFVYNCQQDWRDTRTDRARAGYDNFMPLDGSFAEQVILQIKNGPMDFQVREPISPLFGGLKNTNMMLEVQIAQEYTGQQRHVCYLLPWFKEILNFHTHCGSIEDTIAEIISGRTYQNKQGGIVAVTNTGSDYNWTGHDLAAANLYGFGRLAFDPRLTAKELAGEWIVQTFGTSEKVMDHILKILIKSWPVYEKYTSPLGIGWMVKPNHHYGPDVDGYEYDRWGTYHRADHRGIGVDRTEKGTGYCLQYNEPLAGQYADRNACPEELLLFFHHVEYTHLLSSGKTVLQHIYDTHFEGAEEAKQFQELWKELEGELEGAVYERTLERFRHQELHSAEWRDVINSYFYRKTGIADQLGRKLY